MLLAHLLPVSLPRLGGLLLALLLGAPAASAQPGADLTSFGVLRLEPSARSAALAGSFAAVGDGDVNALFFNPAAPGPATHRRATFSYLNHLSDLNLGSVAYSHTLAAATVSGGLRFAHWGTFEGRDRFGNPTGDFSAGDVVLTAGASRAAGPRLRYGASLHLMHARIDDVGASALAADLGALYRVPSRQLTLGAALRHVGTTLDGFDGSRQPLPLDLQVGLTKRLAYLPVLLTATAYDLTNLSEGIRGGGTLDHVLGHLTFGAELRPGDVLRVRLGYNHRRGRELALTDRFDFAGVGVGFGVNVSGLTVDYAYNSWSSLGGLHQFTLRTGLGDWAE
jgi:hypothetical protein